MGPVWQRYEPRETEWIIGRIARIDGRIHSDHVRHDTTSILLLRIPTDQRWVAQAGGRMHGRNKRATGRAWMQRRQSRRAGTAGRTTGESRPAADFNSNEVNLILIIKFWHLLLLLSLLWMTAPTPARTHHNKRPRRTRVHLTCYGESGHEGFSGLVTFCVCARNGSWIRRCLRSTVRLSQAIYSWMRQKQDRGESWRHMRRTRNIGRHG